MSAKNYLNIHVLISHSPSCLNRDDMNMQKSAIFGGKRRVRISSQSLKRAVRKSDYYATNLGEPSIRTRQLKTLRDKLVRSLEDQFPAEIVTKAVNWVVEKDIDSKDFKPDSTAVAPWCVEEMVLYCAAIQRGLESGTDEKKLKKEIEKQSAQFREAFSNSVDIALSGRMSTSGLMTSVDGAMAMAHSITTHAVDADIDWFVAVDDLLDDEDEAGAGHLNTQEFSSGVFYRYASLNIGQLQENLGNVDRARALEIAKHLVHMMATVVPDAKQQTFAAHNPADLVQVQFSDMPLSLANAFERPVEPDRHGGYMQPSALKLAEYWEKLQVGYGLDDKVNVFTLLDDVPFVQTAASLSGLEAWIAQDARA
jgi:CRISPR system Cascade subunit CasC